jgi:nickel-type superoxide dismutase maturation protease
MSELDGPSQATASEQGSHLKNVASLTWRSFFLWVIGRLERFRISGPSMSPTLSDGVEVLVDCRASTQSSVCVDDLVLIRHPLRSDIRMVKRVVAKSVEAGYLVQGDNASESTDSRQFGSVAREHLLGRVVCTFP